MLKLTFKASVFLVAVMALLGAACQKAQDRNPHAVATTPEQHAFAVYGEWVIAKEASAEVVELTTTPQSVREKVAEVDRVASPIADSMMDVAQEAFKIRAQVRAGTTSEDKLAVVLQNLNSWVQKLEPQIRKLADAIGGVKTEDSSTPTGLPAEPARPGQ